MKQSEAKEWLAPTFRSTADVPIKDQERVREVFRVARDMGLLDADGDDWVSSCALPSTRRALALHVHKYLLGLDNAHADAVLLRAYAWCVAYVQANGPAALVELAAADMAREIAACLGKTAEAEDERAFNATKLSAWKDWMAFLGLGWKDLPGAKGFLADPSRRLLEDFPGISLGQQRMVGDSFMQAISKLLPYLDGGSLFGEACQTLGIHPPKGQLSHLLSDALRTLHDVDAIRLVVEGDTKTGVGLRHDPISALQFFSHIEFLADASNV